MGERIGRSPKREDSRDSKRFSLLLRIQCLDTVKEEESQVEIVSPLDENGSILPTLLEKVVAVLIFY